MYKVQHSYSCGSLAAIAGGQARGDAEESWGSSLPTGRQAFYRTAKAGTELQAAVNYYTNMYICRMVIPPPPHIYSPGPAACGADLQVCRATTAGWETGRHKVPSPVRLAWQRLQVG